MDDYDDEDLEMDDSTEHAAVLYRLACTAVKLLAKARNVPEGEAWRIVLDAAESEAEPN